MARAHQLNKLNLVPILNVRAQTTFSLDAAVSRDKDSSRVLAGSGGLATLDFKKSEICFPEELLAFQRHAVQSRAHSSGEQV